MADRIVETSLYRCTWRYCKDVPVKELLFRHAPGVIVKGHFCMAHFKRITFSGTRQSDLPGNHRIWPGGRAVHALG